MVGTLSYRVLSIKNSLQELLLTVTYKKKLYFFYEIFKTNKIENEDVLKTSVHWLDEENMVNSI